MYKYLNYVQFLPCTMAYLKSNLIGALLKRVYNCCLLSKVEAIWLSKEKEDILCLNLESFNIRVKTANASHWVGYYARCGGLNDTGYNSNEQVFKILRKVMYTPELRWQQCVHTITKLHSSTRNVHYIPGWFPDLLQDFQW